MNSASCVLSREEQQQDLRQLKGVCRQILAAIALAMLFLSGPLAQAQTTAILSGTVQDATGAVIPGAQVTLTDEATGLTHTIVTNHSGI